MKIATFDDFKKIDIRVGKVIQADDFPEAKVPAYKLKIDFGDVGIKKSSAQITKLYSKQDLLNKQVVCVINFPSKQVANFVSEVLVLGAVTQNNDIILLMPDRDTPLGSKIA